MRFVVRFLAVVGALALVLVVAAGVWLWGLSRPSDTPAAESRGVASSPSTTQHSGELRNVRGTIAGLDRSGEATTFEGVDAVGVVPFAVVERRVGGGARLGHDGHGRVTVAAPVSALGRTVDVRAVGSVRADGNDVVVDPESVGLGGSGVVESLIGDAARRAVTIRQPVADLPPGLRVSTIEVADDGFHVRVVGERVSVR